jgi:hypothetical protein
MDNIHKFSKSEPLQNVRLSSENINDWPVYSKLLLEGKVKFDTNGRLRYLHGAPVGDLVLTGHRKDGSPVYNELANEWFDPESRKALEFEWPKDKNVKTQDKNN